MKNLVFPRNLIARISTKPNLFGKLCYFIANKRQTSAIKNISSVFKDHLSASQKKILATAYYSHIWIFIKELARLKFTSLKKLSFFTQVKGKDYLLDSLRKGKGVIVLCFHGGSWELSCITGLPQLDLPSTTQLYFIRKKIRVATIGKLISKKFQEASLSIIPTQNALKNCIELLKKNQVIFYAFDQRAKIESSVTTTSYCL